MSAPVPGRGEQADRGQRGGKVHDVHGFLLYGVVDATFHTWRVSVFPELANVFAGIAFRVLLSCRAAAQLMDKLTDQK